MSDTAPDEGFLAGDKPRQRHSLAGLPLGAAAPADELLHPPAASGNYTATETSYYGFSREPDGLAPRLIEMDLTDVNGRTLQLRGTVEARMPWQTWQNMNTFFCQTRWESAGRVGYGDTQDVQFGDFVRRFARVPP